MKFLEKKYFWSFCFTLIFLLSLDFWHWHILTNNFILFLPTWLFYFMALQIILTASIYFFTLKFWKN